MTRYRWLHDVTPAGTTLNTSNIKTEDNAASATIAGTTAGTATITSSSTAHLGQSAQFAVNTSSSSIMRLPLAAANNSGGLSFYHRSASTAPSTTVVCQARAGTLISSTTGGPRITIATNGTVAMQSPTGVTLASTAAGAWATNRWNRIELVYVSATPTTGSFTLNVYNGDGTTPTGTAAASASDMGTGPIIGFDIGQITQAGAWTHFFDSVQMDNGATAELGPYTPVNDPPDVTLTGVQNLTAGATFSVTATATDDGSVASYLWSVVSGESTSSPSLSGSTAATVTGTVPAAGNVVVLQCVVTDNLGAHTTKTTEIRAPKTGAFTTLALPHVGSWTNVGGATNGGTALRDGSDTTYLESPDYSGTETEVRARLEPLVPRASLTLTPKSVVTATGGTTKFRLYEGNTLRQEWTLTQNTSAATQTVTLSNPAAITDWGNLWAAGAAVS